MQYCIIHSHGDVIIRIFYATDIMHGVAVLDMVIRDRLYIDCFEHYHKVELNHQRITCQIDGDIGCLSRVILREEGM